MSETEKNLTEQEWIDIARHFVAEQSDIEGACYRYFKAREINPNNAEAEFFVDYLGYKQMLENDDKAATLRAFKKMAKQAALSVVGIKGYEGVGDNRVVIAGAIAITFTPLTRYVSTQLFLAGAAVDGVLGLYALGDALKEHFGDSPTITNLAVEAWKEAISIQRKFFEFDYSGIDVENYAGKIREVEPNYIIPKKEGCMVGGISLRM